MAAGGKELEIAIKIAGKVESSFKNALGAATKGIGNIAKAVSAATAAAASAVGAMGIAAINTGREFEGAMSQVAATMLLDKTTTEGQKAFETLENAARECGASTAFSATEAAEALNYLALAGYDATQASDALPTVLNLAGAGAMELAEASDMVTDSMSALGIEATQDNLTDFADKLAKTASKSNTSVAQLGEAILTVGGTAQGLAGGTTELNTALGILADSGIKAAEGGTHLRNMILSLQSARNSDAAALFQEMGLNAYDAEGRMRSLGDVFGDLNTQLAGASAEKVNSVLATIFKQTDLASARAMLAATADSVESLGTVIEASLAESGTSMADLGIDLNEMAANFDVAATQEQFAAQMLNEYGMTSEQAATLFTGLQSVVSGTGSRFEELTAHIEDSAGACEKMYAIQLDNLNGDIDILKSGLSDLGISIYKDLNGPLREMTQLATSMVGELSDAYKAGGMEGMVGAVGGCLSEVVNTIADYAPKVVSLGVELLENFISGITENTGTVADAAADVLSFFVEGLFTLVPQVILAGIDILTQFVQSITSKLPELINTGTQTVANFVNGISARLPEVITTALTLMQTLVNSIGENAPMLISSAVQLIGNLILGLVQMLPQILEMGIQLILNLVQGILSNLPQILQMGVRIVTSLASGIAQMLPTIIKGGIQLILSLLHGITGNLGNIIEAAGQIVGALASGLLKAIPVLLAATPKLIFSILDMIANTDWLEVGINIVTGILKGILSIGGSIVETVKSLFTGKAYEAPDLSFMGAQAGNSFADGIASSGAAVDGALKGISENAFAAVDNGKAAAAGSQAASAFSQSLTGSMSAGGMDAAAFQNNMMNMGSTGAAAFNDSLNAGLAGTSLDMNNLLNASAFDEEMATAGSTGAAAFADGFHSGLSKSGKDTAGALAVDTSGLITELTSAGADGAAALSAGLAENSQTVTQAAADLETGINTALEGGWNKAETSARMSMQQLTLTVTNAANAAAAAVKSAFENMTITIPKPKIPVISVSTNSVPYGAGGNVSIPQFSVNWNAAGGIFARPTIFQTSAGMQGVGEAGAEAVLPLDTLWAKMREIINEAVPSSGGTSLIDTLIEKIKGKSAGISHGTTEFAGAGGPVIQYNPTYNLYGSAGKDEIAETDQMNQAAFNRFMKQYEREQQRRKL